MFCFIYSLLCLKILLSIGGRTTLELSRLLLCFISTPDAAIAQTGSPLEMPDPVEITGSVMGVGFLTVFKVLLLFVGGSAEGMIMGVFFDLTTVSFLRCLMSGDTAFCCLPTLLGTNWSFLSSSSFFLSSSSTVCLCSPNSLLRRAWYPLRYFVALCAWDTSGRSSVRSASKSLNQHSPSLGCKPIFLFLFVSWRCVRILSRLVLLSW